MTNHSETESTYSRISHHKRDLAERAEAAREDLRSHPWLMKLEVLIKRAEKEPKAWVAMHLSTDRNEMPGKLMHNGFAFVERKPGVWEARFVMSDVPEAKATGIKNVINNAFDYPLDSRQTQIYPRHAMDTPGTCQVETVMATKTSLKEAKEHAILQLKRTGIIDLFAGEGLDIDCYPHSKDYYRVQRLVDAKPMLSMLSSAHGQAR